MTPVGDDTARGPALQVEVHHGDLTFIRHPLFLGHYRSERLSGAEAVMDRLLTGAMQSSLDVGLYPDRPGAHQVFLNAARDPENPWRLPRPESVVVLGLGAEGELRATNLVATVRQGVLAWVQRSREQQASGAMEISATLMGSGGSGITAGQSAQLIVQGVHEANERLATLRWAPIERLHLVEIYLDRATEAWRAIRLMAAASPSCYRVDPAIQTGTGGLPRPLEASYRGVSYDFITAHSQKGDGAGMSIVYTLDTKRARTEVRAQSVQAGLVRALVSRAASPEVTDEGIGRTLFRLLVPLEMTPFLSGTTEMLLGIDDGTAGIPWELLDVPNDGGDDRPWAIRSKLLRKLRTAGFRERPVDADAEASVLVIGEPATDEQFARLPGARQEALAVADTLEQRLGADRVLRLVSADDRTPGPDMHAVIGAVMDRPWRVVHVAGHGMPPDGAGNPRGVVLSDDTFLGPNEIQGMPVVPELVFVNCCHLAERDTGELLTETRAIESPAQFAATVAENLIGIGVRCVVAAGWAVDDDAAAAFATTFYEALTDGRRFMDAVDAARMAAHALGGNTWAAYQCYGDPDWTLGEPDGRARRTAQSLDDLYQGIGSASSLRLALRTIEVGSTTQKRDAREQAAKLEYLESRFGARWGDAGSTAEMFARAWKAVGDQARSIAWFDRAVAANDGTATLDALQQLGNQRVLYAWRRVAAAREAGDEAGLAAAVETARTDIASSLELLAGLTAIEPTMEREALLASTQKRLAMIEWLVGNHDAARLAAEAMARHCERGEQLGHAGGRDDVFYPAINRMSAELMLRMGDATWKGFDPDAMAAVRRSLDAKALDAPDFWTMADQANLLMLEGVATGTLAARWDAIRTQLTDLAGRVSAVWMWTAVRDQADFVLAPYALRASAAERKAAQDIRDLVAGHARRS